MSASKKIKLSLYREKCKSLKIKDYGTKNIIADRLKKYYIDNRLGIFDPKSLVVDEEDAVNDAGNYNLIDEKFDILNFDSFNSYINCCKKVHIVKFNREKWENSKCTCWYFLKKFNCYHIFVIAVNEHIISVPTQFRNVKIGQKPKLGRKPKAKKGDALKKN